MTMFARLCLAAGALLGALAVTLGAFGAHGLNDTRYLEKKYADMEAKTIAGQMIPASAKYFRDFETAVEYHMWHALALLSCGHLLLIRNSGIIRTAAVFFFAGILLFSGALYVLVIGGPRWAGVPWGMVAPIGGTSLILGWFCLLGGVFVAPTPQTSSGN